jgi:hypothetical protein
MLALKMKTSMITVSWGVEAVLVFLLGLAVSEASFRRTGIGLLLLCIGKLAAFDFLGLDQQNRWIPFVAIGVAAIFVALLWTRYQDTIRRYL